MRDRIYNNPLFASGLARLVESYMPNPEKEARLQESATRVALNQQRLEMNQREIDGLGAMVGKAMGGGGRRAAAPSETVAPVTPQAPAIPQAPKLTQSELTRVSRTLSDAGYEGEDGSAVLNAILQAHKGGTFRTLDEAAASVLPNVKYSDPVVEPNELFDGQGSVWSDLFRGEEVIEPPKLVLPPMAAPVTAPVDAPAPQDGVGMLLEQARQAIASGADRAAVEQRLRDNGVDPAQL